MNDEIQEQPTETKPRSHLQRLSKSRTKELAQAISKQDTTYDQATFIATHVFDALLESGIINKQYREEFIKYCLEEV